MRFLSQRFRLLLKILLGAQELGKCSKIARRKLGRRRGRKEKHGIRKPRDFCLGRVPNLEIITLVLADDILDVLRQGGAVDFRPTTGFAHAVENVEYDAGESVALDKALLVVWDLANLTAGGQNGSKLANTMRACDLRRA